MDFKNVIGRFFAITFGDQVYEFIVKDNGMMYCNDIAKGIGIKKLSIEPNFWVIFEDNKSYVTCENGVNEKDLIKEFDIFPDLFEFLVSKDAISCSMEMAEFYGLSFIDERDDKKEVTATKDTKSKSKILNKNGTK